MVYDSLNLLQSFHSFDETEASESFRNPGSMDSSILSMSGSWSSLIPVHSRRCLLEWHSVTMVHLEGEVCAKGFVRSLNLRVVRATPILLNHWTISLSSKG